MLLSFKTLLKIFLKDFLKDLIGDFLERFYERFFERFFFFKFGFGLIELHTKFQPSTMSGTGQKVCGGWVVVVVGGV